MISGFYLDDDSSDSAIIPSLIRQGLEIVTIRQRIGVAPRTQFTFGSLPARASAS
jgi:hypothetical protein